MNIKSACDKCFHNQLFFDDLKRFAPKMQNFYGIQLFYSKNVATQLLEDYLETKT